MICSECKNDVPPVEIKSVFIKSEGSARLVCGKCADKLKEEVKG